ncbi:MAG TPA: hypothetical protein VH186_33545 [Chloroflexia bacterium]|nr:hypothetical protein [Chloroflexia bacterium]
MRIFQVDTTKKQFEAYLEMLEFLLGKGVYDNTGLVIGREEAQQTYHKLMSLLEVFKENDSYTIEITRSEIFVLKLGLSCLQSKGMTFPEDMFSLNGRSEIIIFVINLYEYLDEYWEGYP